MAMNQFNKTMGGFGDQWTKPSPQFPSDTMPYNTPRPERPDRPEDTSDWRKMKRWQGNLKGYGKSVRDWNRARAAAARRGDWGQGQPSGRYAPPQRHSPPALPEGGMSYQDLVNMRLEKDRAAAAPQSLYSPLFAQRAVNQMAADKFMQSDPQFLQKQFSRPGVSRDAGTLASIAGPMAQAAGDVAFGSRNIPFTYELLNRQHDLGQQRMRSQEAIDLANILAGFQGNQSAGLSALMSLLG